MRILLVRNPASGSAADVSRSDLSQALAHLGRVEVLEEVSIAALREGVRQAATDADVVAVAGGDGTLSEVVNALADRLDELYFALLPAGTGNDLARTLGIPADPLAAAALDPAATCPVDVSFVEAGGVRRLFVNACLGGYPVEVDEALDDETKRRLGPIAFWVAGVKAASDLERSTVWVNGHAVEDCVAVGVGNGRTAGGGIEVWPDANPCDGLLDVCALGAPGAVGAARLAFNVLRRRHRRLDAVYGARAARITVDADPPLEFNVDGELAGISTPALFARHGGLRLLLPARGGRD